MQPPCSISDYRSVLIRLSTHTCIAGDLVLSTGQKMPKCFPRHRAKAFLKFLRRIDRAVPGDRAVHLVLDSDAAQKTPAVDAWLAEHARFKLPFTPTRTSWL